MAIVWEVSISEQGNSGNYSVTATVTDDTKAEKYQVESVSVIGRMDDEQQKEGLFKALNQEYLAKVELTDAKAIMEAEAKAYLEK